MPAAVLLSSSDPKWSVRSAAVSCWACDIAVHADKEQLTDALGEGQVIEHLRDARAGG